MKKNTVTVIIGLVLGFIAVSCSSDKGQPDAYGNFEIT